MKNMHSHRPIPAKKECCIEDHMPMKLLLSILFLLLSWNMAGAEDQPLQSGVAFNTYLPGQVMATNLFIEVPADATRLAVTITNATGDLDLYLKFGTRLQGTTVSQYDADTDFISDGPTADERIVVTSSSSPPLRAGRWYIGVLSWNRSTTHFTVTATVERDSTGTEPSRHGNSQQLSKHLFSRVKELEADMYLTRLSPVQQAFVRQMGYPNSFSKIITIKDGHVRVDELWFYVDEGLCESFINGIFITETEIKKKESKVQKGLFKPEDYPFNMTMDEVTGKLGPPLIQKEIDYNDTKMKLLIYDGIIFGFLEGHLGTVTTRIDAEAK